MNSRLRSGFWPSDQSSSEPIVRSTKGTPLARHAWAAATQACDITACTCTMSNVRTCLESQPASAGEELVRLARDTPEENRFRTAVQTRHAERHVETAGAIGIGRRDERRRPAPFERAAHLDHRDAGTAVAAGDGRNHVEHVHRCRPATGPRRAAAGAPTLAAGSSVRSIRPIRHDAKRANENSSCTRRYPASPISAAQGRVGQQPRHAVGDHARVILRHEEAGDAVDDDVAGGVVRRADARQPMRHRFEVDDAESLAAARQREHRRAGVALVQRLPIEVAKEPHPRLHAEAPGDALEPFAIVAGTDDHQFGVRNVREHARPRVDHLRVALVGLTGVEPADHQHGGRIVGDASARRGRASPALRPAVATADTPGRHRYQDAWP